jgi:two-component system LytT family sensor kinase
MNQRQFYWAFQIIGWVFYALSDLAYFVLFLQPNSLSELEAMVFNSCIYVLTGISLTHFFKLIFKNYEWIKLPVNQLVIRCLLGVILITSLFTAINISLYEEYFGEKTARISWYFKDFAYIINFSKPMVIWVLLYIFVAYTIEIQKNNIERIRMQASIEASEAKILKAQINPHFMFNALNSIRALILEEPKKAQIGITQLSNILRSSLVANRRTTIPLKEELKTIEDYLALEKVRYEERLQSTLEIDPSTLHIEVPPMMLQTLVENAIKHGVQKAEKWGFVEVKSFIEEGILTLTIRNTGVYVEHNNHGDDSGFGLQNTRRRLNLIYGTEASFNIYQEEPQIVQAIVKIPLEKKVTLNSENDEDHHS